MVANDKLRILRYLFLSEVQSGILGHNTENARDEDINSQHQHTAVRITSIRILTYDKGDTLEGCDNVFILIIPRKTTKLIGVSLTESGGGPGGLALSVIIGRFCNDVEIDLYEAAPEFVKIGAGISVWKRTWFILQLLGIDRTLGKLAVELPEDKLKPGFVFRKSDQKDPGFYYHKNIGPFGSITLHRADMLKVLAENFPVGENYRVHYSKRVKTYEKGEYEDYVTICFEDGSRAQADMVIGCDGIKSPIRATLFDKLARKAGIGSQQGEMLKKHIRASWTGTFAYRSLVQTDRLLRASPGHRATKDTLCWSGKDKHIVSYPISQGRLINLIGFITVLGKEETKLEGKTIIQNIPKQELLGYFDGWEPDARVLLECAEDISKWAIFHVRGLPTYIDDRVALLGDSAHAMATHLGAGAGQAIEDAFVLGRLLSDKRITSRNVNTALQVYDAVRRPFGNSIVERVRSVGLLYEFNDLPPNVRKERIYSGDAEELRKLGEAIYQKWEIQWTELPDEQWREAERFLDEKLTTIQARL